VYPFDTVALYRIRHGQARPGHHSRHVPAKTAGAVRPALALSVFIFLTVLIPVAAFAGPAEELSGLFLQTCLPYAGRPQALRQWATQEKLPAVPGPARAAFLHGVRCIEHRR
jgi:hypothetical protein